MRAAIDNLLNNGGFNKNMAIYIIQLSNTTDNYWTSLENEILEGYLLSWDGTGGAEGDKAHMQFLYNAEVILNQAVGYKDGINTFLPYLGSLGNEVTIKADKDGCTLTLFTKNLGGSLS